jgi:hypothetical protein
MHVRVGGSTVLTVEYITPKNVDRGQPCRKVLKCSLMAKKIAAIP